MSDNVPLNHQVVLLSSADSRMGEAIAQLLARRFPGIRSVLPARIREPRQQVTALRRTGVGKVAVGFTDRTNAKQVEALAGESLSHFGKIGGLLDKSGCGEMEPVNFTLSAGVCRQFKFSVLGAKTPISNTSKTLI